MAEFSLAFIPSFTYKHEMAKNPQLSMLKSYPKAYGGDLLKTRKGREHGRPIVTDRSMHCVLRSSKAKGKWSFRKPDNRRKIDEIIEKFSGKYGVKIYSFANVGNHLHFHLKFSNRYAYKAFIRAITAAIAMAITGCSRWKPLSEIIDGKFWDYRPFTRVVTGYRALLSLVDYIKVNQWEGHGYRRDEAYFYVKMQRAGNTS